MFTIEGLQIGRSTKYQHSALLRKRNSAIRNKKGQKVHFFWNTYSNHCNFSKLQFLFEILQHTVCPKPSSRPTYVKCNGYHNVAYLLHAEQIFEQLFFHLLLWVYKVGKQSLLILWTMNLDCIKCFSMLKYV